MGRRLRLGRVVGVDVEVDWSWFFAFGLGVFGGTYSNGVSSGFGLGLPLFGSPPPSAEPVIQSHALIRLDDMMAYRAGWVNWKLHLRLGSPETSERDVEFPAPRPPDG